MAIVVEGDQKAPISIATTPRCRGGRYSFPWIASLYPRYVPYIAECKARRYQVSFLKCLVWLDLSLNPGIPDHWQTLYPLRRIGSYLIAWKSESWVFVFIIILFYICKILRYCNAFLSLKRCLILLIKNNFNQHCSPMVRETGVQSQVESYRTFKKWYLMLLCLTLGILRYRSRVKWSNPGKGVAPFPTPRCGSYWKGAFGSPSTKVANFTNLYIYIYICVCVCV